MSALLCLLLVDDIGVPRETILQPARNLKTYHVFLQLVLIATECNLALTLCEWVDMCRFLLQGISSLNPRVVFSEPSFVSLYSLTLLFIYLIVVPDASLCGNIAPHRGECSI